MMPCDYRKYPVMLLVASAAIPPPIIREDRGVQYIPDLNLTDRLPPRFLEAMKYDGTPSGKSAIRRWIKGKRPYDLYITSDRFLKEDRRAQLRYMRKGDLACISEDRGRNWFYVYEDDEEFRQYYPVSLRERVTT